MAQIGDRVFYVTADGGKVKAAVVVGFQFDNHESDVLDLVVFQHHGEPVIRILEVPKDDPENASGYWTETYPA